MTDRLTDEQLAAMQVADGFSADDGSPVAEMLVGNTLIGELFRREDAERIVSMLAECLRLRKQITAALAMREFLKRAPSPGSDAVVEVFDAAMAGGTETDR